MPLYLPNSVLEDAERRGQAKAAQRSDALMRYWTEELRRIDPYLTLVYVAKSAHPDLVPYCYHIRKTVPDGADEYWPLIGDDDPEERREPGSWMLEALKANDMYNPRVHRSKKEAAEKRRQARVRAKQTEEEQREDEMFEAAKAAYRLRGSSQLTKTMAHKRAGKGLKK